MSPASYLTAPPRVAAVDCITADLYDPRGVLASLRLLPRRRGRLDRLCSRARVAALEDGARSREDGAGRRRAGHGLCGDGRGTRRLARRRHRPSVGGDHAPAGIARGARGDRGGSLRAAEAALVGPRPGAAQVTRVAAIDLGTNATRLLVADISNGDMTELVRRTRITRLGEGVDARRRLLPVPIARVRNVLSDFRREAEALGAERTLAVATSAVRDAENGEAFLGEVEWSYGFTAQLVSGDEEAELTRAGVGRVAAGTLLLDVGGGSTELSAGDFRASLDIGSVRLTERCLHSDPPAPDEVAAACAAVQELLPPLEVRAAVGVAGTAGQL